MASSSATGPDTIINLKVSHDGIVKKLKLPLRDLGATTLDSKVRRVAGSLHLLPCSVGYLGSLKLLRVQSKQAVVAAVPAIINKSSLSSETLQVTDFTIIDTAS